MGNLFCICGSDDKERPPKNESSETVESLDDSDIFYDNPEVWVNSRFLE